MANGKKGDNEHNADGYKIGTYNVVRRDYYGDPGKNVGVGLSSDDADAYIAQQRRDEAVQCHFEKVQQ